MALLTDQVNYNPQEPPKGVGIELPDTTFTKRDPTVKTGESYVTENSLVDTHVNRLLADDNPFATAARTRAKQDANSRGLLNSAMAVSAGEKAAIDSVLPIAQQNAQTYANANQLQQQTENTGALNTQAAGYNYDQTNQQGLITGALNQQNTTNQNIATGYQGEVNAELSKIKAQFDELLQGQRISSDQYNTLMNVYGTASASLQTNIQEVMTNPDLDAAAKTANINALQRSFEANMQTMATLAGVELVFT